MGDRSENSARFLRIAKSEERRIYTVEINDFHMSPSGQEGQREPQINPQAAKASAVAIVTLVTATFPFLANTDRKDSQLAECFPL